MEQILPIARVIVPILTAVALGMIARRRAVVSEQDVRGLQQFVMKFGLPCVIFNSCLTADIGAESVTSMALVIPTVLFGTLWAFRARKGKLRYHNLPQLFCAQETGMLGIPLFMILFGSAQAYRMGVLDIAQAVTAYPTIAILSAATDENPSARAVMKRASPPVPCATSSGRGTSWSLLALTPGPSPSKPEICGTRSRTN